jgi:hypothetical protein
MLHLGPSLAALVHVTMTWNQVMHDSDQEVARYIDDPVSAGMLVNADALRKALRDECGTDATSPQRVVRHCRSNPNLSRPSSLVLPVLVSSGAPSRACAEPILALGPRGLARWRLPDEVAAPLDVGRGRGHFGRQGPAGEGRLGARRGARARAARGAS